MAKFVYRMQNILAIKEKYANKADYMQVFDYDVDGQKTTFWLIYDEITDKFLASDFVQEFLAKVAK